uniref:Uncharacterized protein n=1 Tax=Anguilla anguilla TaxID=7936 RepID=A0A0E9P9J1_ANGAN
MIPSTPVLPCLLCEAAVCGHWSQRARKTNTRGNCD